MRIAIIGLGSIAQKAYLPLLATRADLEPVFCTRDRDRLHRLATAYRVTEAVTSVEDVVARGVDAAFVHTATESHVQVVTALLRAGVHVYVDKPMTYSYEESARLVELAERVGRILMVGFNRRFAPMYRRLQERADARLIILQKNRIRLPDLPRRFVFDDFIHVADTLRFLMAGEIETGRITAFQHDGNLYHVVVQLDGHGCTAIGVMNRDSGASEEILEVMTPGNKWVVRGLNTTVHHAGGEERITRFGDWESVLSRRGFPQIIDHFLTCVRENRTPSPSAVDALETHALCERIVADVERDDSGIQPNVLRAAERA